MRALDAAQIDGDLGFQIVVDRFGEIVPQQTYSAGMVASASSSNTQWPSGTLASMSARVAVSMCRFECGR